MSDRAHAPLPIASVERDTGIAKDTLRVWERRYGFPRPLRDANGDRLYPSEQVEQLRMIRLLLDQGMRPGKIVALPKTRLSELIGEQPRPASASTTTHTRVLDGLVAAIEARDLQAVQSTLSRQMATLGLCRFVLELLAPLLTRVGGGWARGELDILEEHAFSQTVKRLLYLAIAQLQVPTNDHRVILTTLPGEQHGLGILMTEAILASKGIAVLSLGTETPVDQIVRAAAAPTVRTVGLSFSEGYGAGIGNDLQELRQRLPGRIELWAGGQGTARIRQPLPGVRVMHDLNQLAELDLGNLSTDG